MDSIHTGHNQPLLLASGTTAPGTLRAPVEQNRSANPSSRPVSIPGSRSARKSLPGTVHRLHYTKGMGGGALENVLSGDKENVIVVLSSDETTTDAILAYISSIQNSLIARSVLNPSIRVVGSSRWARFRNIEKNLFFKLNLRYVTSYHADRGNQRVLNFDRRYIADFGSIPSLYAYRGYDVTKLFVGTVKLHGSNFVRYLNEAELPLLQTPYRFVQKAPGRKFENGEWALVCYNNNYTIEVR